MGRWRQTTLIKTSQTGETGTQLQHSAGRGGGAAGEAAVKVAPLCLYTHPFPPSALTRAFPSKIK